MGYGFSREKTGTAWVAGVGEKLGELVGEELGVAVGEAVGEAVGSTGVSVKVTAAERWYL